MASGRLWVGLGQLLTAEPPQNTRKNPQEHLIFFSTSILAPKMRPRNHRCILYLFFRTKVTQSPRETGPATALEPIGAIPVERNWAGRRCRRVERSRPWAFLANPCRMKPLAAVLGDTVVRSQPRPIRAVTKIAFRPCSPVPFCDWLHFRCFSKRGFSENCALASAPCTFLEHPGGL